MAGMCLEDIGIMCCTFSVSHGVRYVVLRAMYTSYLLNKHFNVLWLFMKFRSHFYCDDILMSDNFRLEMQLQR